MSVYVSVDYIEGACSVGNVSNFENDGYSGEYRLNKDTLCLHGGAGYLFCNFVVGDSKSNTVLETLSSKYKVVFQSEERVNVNSGNTTFFCIFDGKDSGEPIGWEAIRKAEDA